MLYNKNFDQNPDISTKAAVPNVVKTDRYSISKPLDLTKSHVCYQCSKQIDRQQIYEVSYEFIIRAFEKDVRVNVASMNTHRGGKEDAFTIRDYKRHKPATQTVGKLCEVQHNSIPQFIKRCQPTLREAEYAVLRQNPAFLENKGSICESCYCGILRGLEGDDALRGQDAQICTEQPFGIGRLRPEIVRYRFETTRREIKTSGSIGSLTTRASHKRSFGRGFEADRVPEVEETELSKSRGLDSGTSSDYYYHPVIGPHKQMSLSGILTTPRNTPLTKRMSPSPFKENVGGKHKSQSSSDLFNERKANSLHTQVSMPLIQIKSFPDVINENHDDVSNSSSLAENRFGYVTPRHDENEGNNERLITDEATTLERYTTGSGDKSISHNFSLEETNPAVTTRLKTSPSKDAEKSPLSVEVTSDEKRRIQARARRLTLVTENSYRSRQVHTEPAEGNDDDREPELFPSTSVMSGIRRTSMQQRESSKEAAVGVKSQSTLNTHRGVPPSQLGVVDTSDTNYRLAGYVALKTFSRHQRDETSSELVGVTLPETPRINERSLYAFGGADDSSKRANLVRSGNWHDITTSLNQHSTKPGMLAHPDLQRAPSGTGEDHRTGPNHPRSVDANNELFTIPKLRYLTKQFKDLQKPKSVLGSISTLDKLDKYFQESIGRGTPTNQPNYNVTRKTYKMSLKKKIPS
eukprot:TRINITY_DN889_c0_g1_i3.p1 TRINITY_DN889_c0_g1~~TRINITY_DN889_c0_g1_i3.p1  ORF type:complete len:692 (+),score=66.44 TRINITY_DN889_c0_g1_i3:408-2483(+)